MRLAKQNQILRSFWLCVALVVVTRISVAEETEEISAYLEYVVPLDGVTFLGAWKYHPGDSLHWADPSYDDSGWQTADPFEIGREFTAEDWPGIGWFRRWVEVDSSLLGQPIGLVLQQLGASEIYLDGELLYLFGQVSADADVEVRQGRWIQPALAVSFEGGCRHLIAVRYSNHQLELARRFPELTDGFRLYFGNYQQTSMRIRDIVRMTTSYQMFFTGLPLAFCLLHFLLFVFYPRQRENLFFAIFALSMAGLTFFAFRIYAINDSHTAINNFWFFKLSLIVLCLSGLHFVHSLFYKKMPLQHPILGGIGLILVIISRGITILPVYGYAVLILAEQLRTVLVAYQRKREGAWIIGIGFIIFAVFTSYQMASDVNVIPRSMYIPFAYLWGFLGMLIAMSVYLARQFALTNFNLEQQIVQVRDLSARAIEQEREAKEREIERLRLEEENKRRVQELEEIKKRQQVLDELEKTNIELEQTNRDLKDTQSQLVQSEKMASLGMLVAGVAHEINTPVGAMSSSHDTLVRALHKLKAAMDETCDGDSAKLMKMEKLMKIINEANEVITSGGSRVTNIVQRLKSFARLDEAELKKADIHEGIEDTLTIVHHELKRKVEIVREFGDVPPIACFPSQLNQVYLNLLINAGQAIKESGTITIRTAQEVGIVRIEFEDTGAGIPAENLDKIFDPGFTTKGVGVGTGLGLSICYKIMQDHHGEIRVESEVGKGTTFTLLIPSNLDTIFNGTKRH
jgi:signal transduction histidine kinase